MSFYPVCIDLKGKVCVVVGGGRVAQRKALGLLSCGARVTVISPGLTEELSARGANGEITLQKRKYRSGDLKGAFLVIAATDDKETQEQVHREATERNLLLNVADVPRRCNFILPATARQGDLVISVSTAGKSPALARKLRMELEKRYGVEYRAVVDILGAVRPVILAAGLDQRENEQLFNELLHDGLPGWIRAGEWQRLENHFADVLAGRVEGDWLRAIRPFYL
jgi:precorrin-2 dehydrogenase/sirohydrochlorin ferrochelatase